MAGLSRQIQQLGECERSHVIFHSVILLVFLSGVLLMVFPVNMTEMGLKWPNAFLPFSHTWPGYGLPLCLEGAIW